MAPSDHDLFGRPGEGIQNIRSIAEKADALMDRLDALLLKVDSLLDGGISVRVGPDGSLNISPIRKTDKAS